MLSPIICRISSCCSLRKTLFPFHPGPRDSILAVLLKPHGHLATSGLTTPHCIINRGYCAPFETEGDHPADEESIMHRYSHSAVFRLGTREFLSERFENYYGKISCSSNLEYSSAAFDLSTISMVERLSSKNQRWMVSL